MTKEPLRLGISGLGTVGSAVIRLLADKKDAITRQVGRQVEVTAVSARDRSRHREVDLGDARWFDDPVDLARQEGVDCFVELIGGAEGVARESVGAALESGKSVVTANKALLAAHGTALARAAEEGGGHLFFEAAIGGGIPIVKSLREALSGNRIERVFGILNGTCNYILTRMTKEGLSFEECLSQAQRLGYAEADPTFDVGGFDTAHKLAILTSLAFGTEIDTDSIYVEGITSVTPDDIRAADELGYRIKLLGVACRTESGIEQRVHPTLVPRSSAIARIDGVINAIAVDGDFVGSIVLSGAGAGGDPTASAVVGDIMDVARGARPLAFGRPVAALEPYRRARMRKHEGGYFLRLKVRDRPGAFASIATAMAQEEISLDSIVQRDRPYQSAPRPARSDEHSQTVVIVTHDTTENAVRKALASIEATGEIESRPQMIRIEDL